MKENNIANENGNINDDEKYSKIGNSNKKISFPKKCVSYMTKFNEDKDLANDNSNIKFKQINNIPKYGIIYFYNESGIYFLDNSNIKELFEDKNDLYFSNLFFLKCKNIFKVLSIEDKDKVYLIIIIKRDEKEENSNSLIIYIDLENLIDKIRNQKKIYNTKIIEELEKEEENFEIGFVNREIDELDKNVELNEDGKYPDDIQWEIKKETIKDKWKKFKNKKAEILKKRDEIYMKSYEKSREYESEKIIYIENKFIDIIIIDKDQYIVLFDNGDIIFYDNYEKIRIIKKEAHLISYNKDTSIFLIVSHDYIYIFKESNNFTFLKEKNRISLYDTLINKENEIIIHCENIYNYIIIYTIDNRKKVQIDDKVYFLDMNDAMEKINKIYLEDKYFFPDDYELEGIAHYSQLKRCVFSSFDKDLGIYMLFNKHMDLLDKYYLFEKKNDNNLYDILRVNINETEQINSRIKIEKKNEEEIKGEDKEKEEKEEEEEEEEDDDDNNIFEKLEKMNPFLGLTLIKFKFDGYDQDKEFLMGQEMDTPFLFITLGFYGGFKIFYALQHSKKLEEKNEFFKKGNVISNKALKISINEEMLELEKEKYINENNKKEKNFTELNNLILLNKRNSFLHGLDQQINENLEFLEDLSIPEKIEIELSKLRELCKNPKIIEIEKSIDTLFKEAKILFQNEDENQLFIDKNKKILENMRKIEINLKNEIKIIEDNKNRTKDLKLSLNTPIDEILTHPKIQNLFGEEKATNMMSVIHKVKNNYNLFENHTNLINDLYILNKNINDQIESCKREYNATKEKYKYLEKRKDTHDIEVSIQNYIFYIYMKVFEQYFYNLEIYENNNLNKEYMYLNQLKINYLKEEKQQINEEEEVEEESKEDNSNTNQKKHQRFSFKQEEDIDEGNNSLSSSEINEKFISTSSNKNKIINFNKSNNIISNDNQIILKNNYDNNNISNYDNDDYLINKEANETIKKIFGTNLVKEREQLKKNYLVDILSNFEGRVTYYNSASDENYCTDVEDLFKEFLIDEDEIKEREMKKKVENEKKEKEKKMIIKRFEDSIHKQKEEKKKIEKELSDIEDRNKKEIIEKEQENKSLKQKLEELEKLFDDNKKEREKEKNKLFEEMEKNKNEVNQKAKIEQKSSDEKIKSLEEKIKKLELKSKEEEKKLKEAEEKIKKLEDEKKSSIINAQNQNQNIPNLFSNNQNISPAIIQSQKKEEDKNPQNMNQNTLFTSNIPPDAKNNVFLQNQDNEKPKNENAASSIFDSLTGNNANTLIKKIDNQQNNDNQNQNEKSLFVTINSNNNKMNNLFSSSNENKSGGIFSFNQKSNNNDNVANSQTQNNLFSQNQPQKNSIFNNINQNQPQISSIFNNINQNQPQTNSIFNSINQTQAQNNKNDASSGGGLFSNVNFGGENQSKIFGEGPSSFGIHRGFGFGQGNANNKKNNPISLQLSSNNSNDGNSTSPFAGISSGNGLFKNNQSQNNNNSENFFG